MSEKMRGAIFSALGDISGLTVLDAYSGSGALAIESISRGAIFALVIESDPRALKVITENLKVLGLTRKVKLVFAKVESWLKYSSDLDNMYDLIFADPPYSDLPEDYTLNSLCAHLKASGIFVLSWPGRADLPQLAKLKLVKNKSFNDAQIAFYKAG